MFTYCKILLISGILWYDYLNINVFVVVFCRGHNAAVLCVQFDDRKIVSGSYDKTIKVGNSSIIQEQVFSTGL